MPARPWREIVAEAGGDLELRADDGRLIHCACCGETIRNEANTGFRCGCRWADVYGTGDKCDRHREAGGA